MKARRYISIHLQRISSKAFHTPKQPNILKKKTIEYLVEQLKSKKSINKNALNLHSAIYKQLIQRSYHNSLCQRKLCQLLSIPFTPGPISLNSIPQSFFNENYIGKEQGNQIQIMTQLNHLFEYLKKVSQKSDKKKDGFYVCWVIYYNEELQLLSVKLMKRHQLRQNVQLLNEKYCLIGLFIRQGDNSEQNNIAFNLENNYGIKTTDGAFYANSNLIEIQQKLTMQKTASEAFIYEPTKKRTNSKVKAKRYHQTFKFISPVKMGVIIPKQSSNSFKSLKSSAKTCSSSIQSSQSLKKSPENCLNFEKNEKKPKQSKFKKKSNNIQYCQNFSQKSKQNKTIINSHTKTLKQRQKSFSKLTATRKKSKLII